MSKNKAVGDSITGLVALLCTVAFLLIGFLVEDSWRIAWVVFLLIPITSMIVGIVRRRKDVQGLVTGIVALLATAGFLLIGFLVDGAWRVCWIIFFAIPISGVIVKMATGGKEEENPPANEGQ